MEERLIKFSHISVPTTLVDSVVLELAQMERVTRARLVAFAVVGIVAVIGISLWQWNLFATEWNGGWIDYLRLAFSDPDVLFNSTRNFAAGFLEVLPTKTLFVGSMLIFFFSAIPPKAFGGNQ